MATETFILEVRARGTQRTTRDLRRIGDAAQSVRKTLALMRNALVAIAAIRVFSDLGAGLVEFSDGMLTVQAVTRATAIEFQGLKETAQELGATTRFTASEVADGMIFLGRAGFTTGQIYGSISATLDLAAASALDLGRAADIASNLMTSFGLAAKDTRDIVDTLVFTANNANTNVQQLGDGLKLVAPIASQLGSTLAESAAVMGILGNAGLQATLAGTAFRRVLINLETPTGNLAKILKIVGLTFDDVRPSTEGFITVLKRLKEAQIGASAAGLAFGARGGPGFAVLVSSISLIEDFIRAEEKAGDIARETARIMESQLGGALRRVRSAFEAVIIAVGEFGAEQTLTQGLNLLADALRSVARNIDNVIDSLAALLAIFVATKIIAFGAALLRVAGILTAFLVTFSGAPVAFIRAAKQVGLFAAALLRIPFAFILKGFAVAIAAVVGFGDEIEIARGGSVLLSDAMEVLADTVQTSLVLAFQSAGVEVSNFTDLVELSTRLISNFLIGIAGAVGALVEGLKSAFKRIEVSWRSLVLLIESGSLAIQSAWNDLPFVTVDIADNLKSTEEAAKDLAKAVEESAQLGGFLEGIERGYEKVKAQILETAAANRAAERDARIDFTDRQNRLAALARKLQETRENFAGRTDLAQILDDLKNTATATNTAEKAFADLFATQTDLIEALQKLEAQFFPVNAALQEATLIEDVLTQAREAGLITLEKSDELTKRWLRSTVGAGNAAEVFAEKQRLLNAALEEGAINLEEHVVLSRQLRINELEGSRSFGAGLERFFLKLQDEATNAAAITEKAFTSAFEAMGDALAEFLTTGSLDINTFMRDLASQLISFGTQQLFTGIAGSISGAFAGGTAGSGNAGGGLGALIGSFLGGAQRGANFTVGPQTSFGSLPGADNRIVAFRAQDGEDVTVTPRNERGRIGPPVGGTTIINFPVAATSGPMDRTSITQQANRVAAVVGNSRTRR